MTRSWLVTSGGSVLQLKLPAGGFGAATCPVACECGSDGIVGGDMEREGHDGYVARGFCARCRTKRGTIHAKVSTLFGIEEDQAVLGGPWKVY